MASDLKSELRTWQQMHRLYGLRLHRAEEVQRRAKEKLMQAHGERDAVSGELGRCRDALRQSHGDFVAVALSRPMDAKALLAHAMGLGRTRESLRQQLAVADADVERQRERVRLTQRALDAVHSRCGTVDKELRRLRNAWADRVEEQER